MSGKKSSKQKELEGTDRPDRSGEIPSVDEIPAPSKGFPREARPFYDLFAQHLLDNKALQNVDSIVLERAAKCALRLDKAEKEMDAKGAIQTYKTGNRNISPEYTLFDKTEKRFLEYCSLLGISPKARHLMAGSFEKKKETKKDPFAMIGGHQPGASE